MAHFGTTESSLTFFLTAITYYSLDMISLKGKKINWLTVSKIGFLIGLAVATKVTAIFFITAPLFAFFTKLIQQKKVKKLGRLKKTFLFFICTIICIGITTIIFSPHYLLYFKEFSGALLYERALVTGAINVFYTRQFFKTVPVLFQFIHVFPFMLGVPIFGFSLCGFFLLSWRKKEFNLLRVVLLAYFLPTAFLYAKWARYQTPIIPLLTLFSILFFERILNKKNNVIQTLIVIMMIIPGIAYLSIYVQPDVRFTSSNWIYQNIPNNSHILSETANVIDIPIQMPSNIIAQKNYNITEFDFYNVDIDVTLQQKLKDEIKRADYIFVPSRRIFMNHGCIPDVSADTRCAELKKMYPILNDYYEKLFSGNLGFKQVAEITAYPKISLFGHTFLELPDEAAEETWTVFDHPVIRIYKRI